MPSAKPGTGVRGVRKGPRAAAAPPAEASLKDYAKAQIEARLSKTLFEMRRARRGADAEGVHDLRVSLRRLFAALRVFRDLFARKHAGRIRKELRPVLKLAGEVRNRDIGLALAQEAGVGSRAAARVALQRERKAAASVLRTALRQAESRDVAHRWRKGAW